MPGAKARLRLDGADPINQGLRAFLPLNDSSFSTFQDISPYRRVSGAVNARARVASPFGEAAAFVSPNELINVGGPASLASSSDLGLNGRTSLMAMAGWVYLSSTSLAGAFFKIGSATGGFGLGVGSTTVDAAGGNIVALYEAVRWIPTGFAFSIGWHHVAISLNGSGHPSIYYDGRLIYSDATGAPNAVGSGGAGYCYIGTSQLGSRFFTGTLSGVRAWGRGITAGEAQRLYRDPWAGTARNTRRAAYRPPVTHTFDPSPVAYRYTTAPVTFTYEPAQTGDTHDGFIRRSRRQRAAEAAEQRRRVALAQEAVALRLELEAAMGMAAEVVEEAPAAAVEAVQTATKAARVAVPAVPDLEGLAVARQAVAALLEAVEEARRAKALADDDEDVLMLLRAL